MLDVRGHLDGDPQCVYHRPASESKDAQDAGQRLAPRKANYEGREVELYTAAVANIFVENVFKRGLPRSIKVAHALGIEDPVFGRPHGWLADPSRSEASEKPGQRLDVLLDARGFQASHIFSPSVGWNDHPWQATGSHHGVHEEPSCPAIYVQKGMHVDEDEVT